MTDEKSIIRVLIVDDHPIIRHGLNQLISQEEDIEVCGEAEDGPQALAAVEELQPDIVLLDITLKTTNGLDIIGEIRQRMADVPILMLTMHDEARYAERSLRSGAQGYVMKQDPPEQVVQAIRTVLGGEIYLSNSMTSKMLKKFATGPTTQELSPADQLSSRELEIFKLIGEGKGTREVADLLQVSIKTVDAHRANIKRKLELKSGTELVQKAIKWTLSREAI